ncbi:methylated-DNA--[protein]-cysteine S-methyltransferase [Taklimakanibacter lacteus]|uniref:methylated-DNA--[protein]-cysteine S-methyltransferase n=1 Tax=Taklimakanibacter lacteus TaxID=2268456 RepID=UPI0013C4312D
MTLDISTTERHHTAPPVQHDDPVRYAFGASFLGEVLVATTGKGICAIFLGSDRDRLADRLREHFPLAQSSGNHDLDDQVARVIAHIEAPTQSCEMPLDLRGSDFEIEVWQALRAIPPGKTLSYSGLARRIGATGGAKGAAKAVADACVGNKIAVLIPCHRILRKDGSISGYRWGVQRKRALLRREGAL